MDKHTLSQYGWAVIVIIIIAVLLGLATPFGNFIGESVTNTIHGFAEKTGIGSSTTDNTGGGSASTGDGSTRIDVPEAEGEVDFMYLIAPSEENNVLQSHFTQPIPVDGDIPAIITYTNDETKNITLSKLGTTLTAYDWCDSESGDSITFYPNKQWDSDNGPEDSTTYHRISLCVTDPAGDTVKIKSITLLGYAFTPVRYTVGMIADGIEFHGSPEDIKRVIVDFADGVQSVFVNGEIMSTYTEGLIMHHAIYVIQDGSVMLNFIGDSKVVQKITIEEEVSGVPYATAYDVNAMLLAGPIGD